VFLDFTPVFLAGRREVAAYARRGLMHVREAARASLEGNDAVSLKALELAAADYSSALGMAPDLVQALVSRAARHAEWEAALRRAGRNDEARDARGHAVRDLEAVASLAPSCPVALFDRGLLRLRMATPFALLDAEEGAGLLRGAESDARECLKLVPRWRAARDLLERVEAATK
jgi:hypothetical protein